MNAVEKKIEILAVLSHILLRHYSLSQGNNLIELEKAGLLCKGNQVVDQKNVFILRTKKSYTILILCLLFSKDFDEKKKINPDSQLKLLFWDNDKFRTKKGDPFCAEALFCVHKCIYNNIFWQDDRLDHHKVVNDICFPFALLYTLFFFYFRTEQHVILYTTLCVARTT